MKAEELLVLLLIVTICVFATCVSYMFVVVNIYTKVFGIVGLISIILFWVFLAKSASKDIKKEEN